MQLMVDTGESPALLQLAAKFLTDAAALHEDEAGPPAVVEVLPRNPAVYEDARVAAQLIPSPRPPLSAAEVFAQPAQDAAAARAVFAKPGEGFPPAPSEPIVIPPPPPPTVSAATAPAASTASTITTSSPTVDADGLPHDPRIHSETPTVTKDGRWRRRRNLDPHTLAKVEAELRGASSAPVSLPVGGTAPAPAIPPPPPPVVAAPNAPTAPVIPPPPVANPFGFRALMNKIDGHTGAGGKLSADAMKPVHAEFGATGWPDYVHLRLDKIPALMARIDEMLK